MLFDHGVSPRRAGIALLAFASALLIGAPRASACGGFFCDRGQTVPDAFGNPPPSQSGEDIVYGIESDGSLTMTVRIFYQGAAPEFAWILPVPVVPTISLGTDALFTTLDSNTRPFFYVGDQRIEGTCAADPVCIYPDAGFRYYDAAFAASDAGAAHDGGGVVVEMMSTLGPYETVVLTATSGAEVQSWLSMHGYLIPTEATPLLDAYAMTGSHFVALRLRGDATIDQIQPVTLTMAATSPCLPIRLTALATQPDLPITAYFLGDARAVSSNYSMLDLDYADLGLYQGSTSYASYVTRATDAAGGHAFATDYAGTTPTASLELPSILDLGTATDARTLLQQLQARGYLMEPQMLGILATYVVPPAGMMARAYYNCLIYGTGPFLDAGPGGCGDPMTFDPMGAVTAIDQAITQPRHDAQALLTRHPYTTRLYTTMSAAEMTLDPEFRLDSALHDVSNSHIATRVITCDSGHYLDEAGGHYLTSASVRFGAFAPQPHLSQSAWCARRGAMWTGDSGPPSLDAGHYPDGAVAMRPVTPTGGGGCSVTRTAHGGGAWLALALLALFAQARRRRSRQALPAASPSRSSPGTIAPSVVP